jgi:SAM-dependent methyltransferase
LPYQELFEGAELSSLPGSLHSGDATGAIQSAGTQSTVPPDLALVCNDVLLRCLLENAPVCDIGLERFLTMARHILLDTAIDTSLEHDAHDRSLFFMLGGPIGRGAAGNCASSAPFAAFVPYNTATSAAVDEQALIFYCSLARQCFINEYVFECTTNECGKTEVLRERITAMLATGLAVPALWIIAFAAYHPLIALPSARTLLDSFPDIHAPSASSKASGISGSSAASVIRDAPIAPEMTARQAITALLVQQVCEPMEEKGNRALIPRLTPLAASSRRVQYQYEQNPYPRWVKLPVPTQRVSLEDDLRQRFPFAHFQPIGSIGPTSSPAEISDEGIDILVAGCGTGQHSIATRQRYRNARILAVDLSLASLCYARRKANESGLDDITHAQADIMALDPTILGGRTFDLIESMGVLHHLADPLAGWRKLLGLLRPGGLMRLGFYSALARENEIAAQDFARNFLVSFGRDAKEAMPEDIRRCRQAIMATGNACTFRQVLSARDFYTMSECRDLLFHVQEHCYTLPQLKEQLAQLSLSFVGFSLDRDTLVRYSQSFPDDSAQTDLDNWHLFEIRNPDTFTGMYQFWVQKA